jgi:hypothetical protein
MKDCAETRGPNDWDLDFSYGLLRALYGLIAGAFRTALLGDALTEVSKGGKVAFVRHDLDVSLRHGRRMAEFEAAELGLRTTYHVMTKSPFYEPAKSKDDLAAILGAGHELGLHFDATGVDVGQLEASIDVECKKLEDVFGTAVRSLSFHIPPQDRPEVWKGPATLAGRVNGYGRDVFPAFYLSDSCGRWREGDPRESITKPRGDVLQILVHPIWWGRQHVAAPDRLGAFVEEVARERGISFEDASEQVYRHILYRARKPSA